MTSGHAPARGPWDVGATLGSLRHHDLPGVQRTEGYTHTRVLAVGGRHLRLRLHLEEAGVSWQTCSPGTDEVDPATIDALVTWWFDLDADTTRIDRHLAADPYVGDQVRRRPGVRITRHPDPREGVLTTILGQQVSLAAARTFAGRLAAAYGEQIDHVSCDDEACAATAPSSVLRTFPDPRQVADVALEDLRRTVGLTGARAQTLHAAAALLAAEAPDGPARHPKVPDRPARHPEVPDRPARHPAPPSPLRVPRGHALGAATLDRLAALRGIGPWTRAILALRAGATAMPCPRPTSCCAGPSVA